MRLTYIGGILQAAVFVVVAVVIVRAWLLWRPEMLRLSLPKWRGASSIVGLLALRLATLAVFGFFLHTCLLGGFGNNLRPVVLWSRAGFWLSVLALASAALGKGKTRSVTLVCATVTALFWIAVAMAM